MIALKNSMINYYYNLIKILQKQQKDMLKNQLIDSNLNIIKFHFSLNLNLLNLNSLKHENEITILNTHLAKTKLECENYKNESDKFLNELQDTKTRSAKTKEELKRKM